MIVLMWFALSICAAANVIEIPLTRITQREEEVVNGTHKRLLDDVGDLSGDKAAWYETNVMTQEIREFQVNTLFTGRFYMGSQKQPLNLAIDTGSSRTWTLADNCTQACANIDDMDPTKNFVIDEAYWSYFTEHVSYHPKQSTSLSMTDYTRRIKYMGGDVVNGPVAKDTLMTATVKPLTVTNFPIILQTIKT